MKGGRKNHRVYLEDIASAIDRIEEYSKGGSATFLSDGLLQDGIIRQLSIIGEAASKLPLAIRAGRPDIPWKRIVGMRNVIIHDYSEVDLPTIWETVERDVPMLRKAISALLNPVAGTDAA